MDSLRVAFSLVGIVVIIIAAYYATWFISVKASGRSGGKRKNKNISLIDRFAISKDKSFCLVEVAGKVYVIGITNQSMTLIDTLDPEAITETDAQQRDTASWQIAGGSFTSRMTKRIAVFLAQKMGRQPKISDEGGGATFADSIKKACVNNATGQPGYVQAEQAIGPEEIE